MKPYPKYKASGVHWLGPVPSHWNVEKLKYIVRFIGGGTPSKEESAYWEGDIPWVSPKDMKRARITDTEDYITEAGLAASPCTSVPVGSVLVVVRSGILQHTIPVAVNRVAVTVNQDLKALVPGESIDGNFLAYQIQGCNDVLLDEWVKQGATVESVEHQRMADTRLALPPLLEQLAVVDYLDAETARIDELIGEKTELIALLREHRQGVASDVVIRGLDRERAMRPVAGGFVAIPAHWRFAPLKRFVRVVGGHTPSTDNPAFWDGSMPWVSPKDMKREEVSDSVDHVTDAALKECGLTVVEPGATLVVVRGMILAHTFPVARNVVPVTINQDMKAIQPESDLLPEYLPWLLRGVTPVVLSLTEQSAHGTLALRTDKFFGEAFPIPPIGEQIEIVEFLQGELPRIDELIAHTQDEIRLLKELRLVTLTDAVLGRFDVRTLSGSRPS